MDIIDEALRGRSLPSGPVAADTPMRRAAFRSVRGGEGPRTTNS
ncbi:hypothetical protein [Streptomyces sp. NBC_00467]